MESKYDLIDALKNAIEEIRIAAEPIYDEVQKAIGGIYSLAKNLKEIYSPEKYWNEISDAANKLLSAYAQSLSNSGITEFVLPDWSKLISSMLEIDSIINISGRTAMVNAIDNAIGELNIPACIDAIKESMNNLLIPASDIAFLKRIKISDETANQASVPTQVIKAIKNLNQLTAKSLISDDHIVFDTESGEYVCTGIVRFDDANTPIISQPSASNHELNYIGYFRNVYDNLSDGEELLSVGELIQYMDCLDKYPNLALNYEVGMKILGWIQYLWDTDEHATDFDSESYYHARTRKSNIMPYTSTEMMEAPPGVPGAGRFNHPGHSLYYVTNEASGAYKEVKKHCKQSEDLVVQIAVLRPKESVKLLDLSKPLRHGKEFCKYLQYNVDNPESKMPREYLISHYVSDCCRSVGFDGIKYFGSKSYNNYVLWDRSKLEFVEMIPEYDNTKL